MTAVESLLARIQAAGADFEALRPAVEAGAPWPLDARFSEEPEANWGPPEVLAHVTEMLPYWLGEIERVLSGAPEPVPFGRLPSDPVRIAIIGRDRTVPLRELQARIVAGAARYAARVPELSPAQAYRRGLHPTRGEMTVADMIESFVAAHMEGHVVQLRSIIGTGGQAAAG
ncbi:MAG: hypothetical protein ACHQDE_09375 [Acidimicrobiia bacterium]